jgi:hypothetical protein
MLLIEIGVLVLAVVLVWYFYLPIGIIGPFIGFVVAGLCILLLPRVVKHYRKPKGVDSGEVDELKVVEGTEANREDVGPGSGESDKRNVKESTELEANRKDVTPTVGV